MRPPQIIPVEELSKAALLFDAVGRWPQVDPFVLHGPPQALDKDVVVAAPASIHADLDPVIPQQDRKSTRLNSSHLGISYAVFCLKKKKKNTKKTRKQKQINNDHSNTHDRPLL